MTFLKYKKRQQISHLLLPMFRSKLEEGLNFDMHFLDFLNNFDTFFGV